ncbi:hypothetical protein CABS03_13706 [Colletotrichum abscissum]|uniref:Nephrocystin 3-like N-terminal domain-containing protein n=1 Tax=Colletotrichum abscissum TaxID=1671311 RepID=A0A9Q0AWI8_9PEZI|nr:hypothetical protein CABS02_14834 [Colletotrichum abscissum]
MLTISLTGADMEDNLTRCIDALFIADPEVDLEELIESKGGFVEGTCRWVRSEESYRSWLESKQSAILCISGLPGTGKTMLSYFITKELEKLTQSIPGDVLFYFYNPQYPEKNTTTSILRTWLHEIFTNHRTVAKYAVKRMTPRRTENTLKSRSTLWAIFTATIKDPELGPVYCVLDGLNDFPPDERRWLVSSFQAQFGRSSGAQVQPETLNTFKLIISSAANEGFHECLHLTSTLDKKDPKNDLKCVIKARLARHRHWGILDKESQDALAGELSLRSEGLFSWVDFMLEDLYPEKTLSAMMKKMDQIPCGLRHVFLRLLVQIDDKSRRETAKILQWVALLRRPVTVAELTDLIHPDAEEPEEERQRIQDLVSESYPLMRITKAGWDYEEREAEEDIILPLHRSIADYMTNIDMDSAIKDFYFKPEKTHYEIAKICLDELQIWFKQVLPSTNILHICSGLGFLQIVRTLLEKHPDAASYVNEEEEDGDTPLSYATRYNHSDVAELLVRYGAHVMRQINEIYWNNLEYAFHIPVINAFANANVRLARFLIKPTCAQMDDPSRKVMLGIYLICEKACVSKGTKSRQLAELVLDHIEINITEMKEMFSLAPWRRSVCGHPWERDNLDVPDLIISRLLRSDRRVLRDVHIFPSAVGYAARHPSIGAELLRACLIPDIKDVFSSESKAKTTLHPIVVDSLERLYDSSYEFGYENEAIDTALFRGSFEVVSMLIKAGSKVADPRKSSLVLRISEKVLELSDSNFNLAVAQGICKRPLLTDEDINARVTFWRHEESDNFTLLDLYLRGLLFAKTARFALFLMQHGARCSDEEDSQRLLLYLAPLARGVVTDDDWDWCKRRAEFGDPVLTSSSLETGVRSRWPDGGSMASSDVRTIGCMIEAVSEPEVRISLSGLRLRSEVCETECVSVRMNTGGQTVGQS